MDVREFIDVVSGIVPELEAMGYKVGEVNAHLPVLAIDGHGLQWHLSPNDPERIEALFEHAKEEEEGAC